MEIKKTGLLQLLYWSERGLQRILTTKVIIIAKTRLLMRSSIGWDITRMLPLISRWWRNRARICSWVMVQSRSQLTRQRGASFSSRNCSSLGPTSSSRMKSTELEWEFGHLQNFTLKWFERRNEFKFDLRFIKYLLSFKIILLFWN